AATCVRCGIGSGNGRRARDRLPRGGSHAAPQREIARIDVFIGTGEPRSGDRAPTNIAAGIAASMPTDDVCGVQGCGKEAKRSLSTKKVKEALPELKLIGEPRRVHLCKDHYKQFRKKTKQERELDRAAWQ